jgi:DNA-binding SARP family transcriptional activator
LKRYRGVFLQGESAPWAIAFRDRLHAQYMRMAERLGALLEQEGDASAAIDCYLRAIEVEPLAEAFYRHLMNAYARLDRRSEALAVYQRCRQSLLVRLGVSPTLETQQLYRMLADT